MIWDGREHFGPTFVLTVAVAVLIGGASAVWACTPQLQADADRDVGAAGSDVTIRGSYVSDVSVEVFWNEVSGQQMGSAQGKAFSIAVRIPQVDPGWNYIELVASDANGPVGKKSFAFRVVADDKRAPSGDEPAPRTSGGANNPPPSDSAPAPGASSTGESAAPASGTSEASPAVGGTTAGADTPTATSEGNSTATKAGLRGRSAPVAVASQVTTAPPAAGDQPMAPVVAIAEASADPPERQASAIPAGTLSTDLWSGFASGSTPRLGTVVEEPSPRTSDMAAGLALLTVGLGGLLAAVAIPARRARSRHRL